ncbi:DUF6221 family protein [Streptomyces sp. NPDC088746]|uniref:DUF6221 family protein n=1 Tax=Streptomyces sp. NPDC088746 TaxID=3365885 RepID=UPI0037FD6891
MSSTDLMAFLRARLDEDERTAKAATPAPWCDSGGYVTDIDQDGHSRVQVTEFGTQDEDGKGDGPQGQADSAHIARQDPARALREAEAKRRVLRAHEKWCEGRCEAKYPEGGFDAAHYWSIKTLAAVYADHRDYREAWRP